MNGRLKVLGCSGSEAKGVHPCSFLLGDTILLDAGSAASLLSLAEQQRITTIFLTHCHLDHIKDLAFLGENVFSTIQDSITVYGSAPVLAAIQKHFFNDVIWPNFTRLPTAGKAVFQFVPIATEQSITIAADLSIQAVEVHHPGPTFGYVITGKQRAVVYTGDTGPTERIWQLVRERDQVTDLLLEASFPNRLLALAKAAQHLTSAGLALELEKLGRKDIKVHVYHMKAPYQEEIQRELANLKDGRIRLLQSGDAFELS